MNLDWNHRPKIPETWVKVTSEQLSAVLVSVNYRRDVDGCDIVYKRVSNGVRFAIERTYSQSALSGEAWIDPSVNPPK